LRVSGEGSWNRNLRGGTEAFLGVGPKGKEGDSPSGRETEGRKKDLGGEVKEAHFSEEGNF